jgi:hypothetical protein
MKGEEAFINNFHNSEGNKLFEINWRRRKVNIEMNSCWKGLKKELWRNKRSICSINGVAEKFLGPMNDYFLFEANENCIYPDRVS